MNEKGNVLTCLVVILPHHTIQQVKKIVVLNKDSITPNNHVVGWVSKIPIAKYNNPNLVQN